MTQDQVSVNSVEGSDSNTECAKVTLSVVVPCYNEAENIPLIFKRFKEILNRSDVELVLVNNGSTDHSARVFDELLPANPFARLTHVPVNQGYGYGILQGLKDCRGTYVGWTHADMQTDPGDILKALQILEKSSNPEKTYVKGMRRGRPLFDNFFTAGMSFFETVYMGAALWDINAQPNIFHRTFFESWSNPPYDFALDLYALYMARKQNLNVIRFDVVFPPRIHGTSKWNTGLASKWKFIVRTMTFSKSLKERLSSK